MSHKLIVGQTLSGKSTLARAFAADAQRRGLVVAVYDPTLSDWNTPYISGDEDIFFEMLADIHAAGAKCTVFVDEADTVLSMSHRHNWWLFTRGRHFRFESCAITQRPTLIAPTVRNNAPELFVFHLGKSDSAALAEDYGAPGIIDAPELRQGEFLRATWRDGKKVVDKLRVF